MSAPRPLHAIAPPSARSGASPRWDWLPRLPGWLDPVSSSIALKTCVSLVIAQSIALWMDWSPTGASFACIMLQTTYLGRTLGRSVLRIAGAVAGSFLALAMIALFAQAHVALLTSYALLTGLIIYLEQMSRYPYAFLFVLFSVGVITFGSIDDPQNAFDVAVSWVSGNALGITITLIIHGVLWPHTGGKSFERQLRAFLQGLARLFTLKMAALSHDRGSRDEIDQLENRLIASVAQLRLALGIASRDTDRLHRFQAQYAELLEQLQSLMSVNMAYGENLRIWRGSRVALEMVPHSPVPGSIMATLETQLDDLVAAPDRARDGTGELQGPDAQHAIAAQIEAFRQSLRTRDHSALEAASFDAVSEKAIETSRSITSVRNALATVEQPDKHAARATPPKTEIDPITAIHSPAMRLQKAAIGVVAVAVASLLWINLDWPTPSALLLFVVMPVAFNAMVPTFPIAAALRSLVAGPAIAAVLYFGVMPRLDGMWQLAPVLMLFFFPNAYLTNSANAATMLSSLFTNLWVVELIDLSQGQVYSFASFADELIGIVGGVGIALAALSFFNQPVPERQFKNHTRAFFQRCERTIRDLRRQAPQNAAGGDLLGAGRAELLELLSMCNLWLRQLDARRHPPSELTRLDALIETMWAIVFRLDALEEARQRYADETLIAAPSEHCSEAAIEGLSLLRRALATSEPAPAMVALAGAAAEFRSALEPLLTAAHRGEGVQKPLHEALTLTGFYCGLADAIEECRRSFNEIDWRTWDLAYF